MDWLKLRTTSRIHWVVDATARDQSKSGGLVQANGMLKEARERKADIMFRPPADNTNKVVVTTFSDAAFNISQSATYWKTGIVCGIRFVAGGDDEQYDVYHLIDLASLRQRRVCYSSYGAEILACTEADNRG